MTAPRPSRPFKTALWILALWAMVLSVESWFRTPGSLRPGRLPPPRLVLDGAVYERDPAVRQRREVLTLPSSAALVRHWMVRYRHRNGDSSDQAAAGMVPSELLIARVQPTGSGRANRLPFGRIDRWMGQAEGGDQSSAGGCLISDGDGGFKLLESRHPNDTSFQPPSQGDPWRFPLWLLGLRSLEEVNCVWIGSDRPLSAAALQGLARQLP